MKQIHNTPEARYTNSKSHKKYYIDNPQRRNEISSYLKSRHANPEFTRSIIEKAVETRIGGFWYGNVRYNDTSKYCEKFNEDFKERCRAYWGWTCVICGKEETTRRLSIHHVHYDKKMCCNGSPKDVVALCSSCHTATNVNRDMWEDAFTKLIYEEHNGKSYFTKEEFSKLFE